MSAQYEIHEIAEDKEVDGAYAIQIIEETVQDIIRHNAFPAEQAADQMMRFAKGWVEVYLPTQRTTAVQQKIQAMVNHLLNETPLTLDEIKDLIIMVTHP